MAFAVVALGGFVVFEAVTGPDNPGYAQVGPGVFPALVGLALVLAGFALLLQGLRGQWRVIWIEPAPHSAHSRESGNPESLPETPGSRFHGDERKNDAPLRNVLLVAAALILDIILLPPLGFIAASAVLFFLVAAAFGSRRFILDAALGLVFGGAIYVVFVHGLGLHLPIGTFWGTLLWMR